MPNKKKNKFNLTIFLLKKSYKSEDEFIQNITSLQGYDVGIGKLYVRQSSRKSPKWIRLFENRVSLKLFSASSAAVLAVKTKNRLFGITFGHGHYLLKQGSYENRFGLKVTLNSIKPDSIKCIDKDTFDSLSRRTREQTSRQASISEFNFDVEQALLKFIVGAPEDETLGSHISGRDSLHITIEADLDDIPPLLEKLSSIYDSDSYKKIFPWFDQISEVKDPDIIDKLNVNLVKTIKTDTHGPLWLAPPTIIDWEDFGGFKYRDNASEDYKHDIFIDKFKDTVEDLTALSIPYLKHRKIFCYRKSDGSIYDSWPVYKCIYFETNIGGDTYLLNDSTWYSVAPDFVKQINDDYDSVPRSAISFPICKETEPEYNKRVCRENPTEYALMDCKVVRLGGGLSAIEFCDLYRKDKKIIHVKKYSTSSVLSHLFAQGVVSTKLFSVNQLFRRKVNEMLPSTHKILNPNMSPNPKDYEIVYAIISSKSGDVLDLPFFSKINLKYAIETINAFGYQVSLCKIIER